MNRSAANAGASCIMLAACLVGCASPAPIVVDQTPQEPWIESILPPGDAFTASDMYPGDTGRIVYEVIEGEDIGATVTTISGETDQYGAHWQEATDSMQVDYLLIDETGAIVLPAAADHEEDAVTLFDPPLVIAFDRLPPGEARVSESSMRVVRTSNPDRNLESGTATRSTRYVDDAMIRTPLGTHRAKRIEVRFQADLRFASADISTVMYCVPGMGVVIKEKQELVKVLGITRTNRRQVFMAVSVDQSSS